MTYEEFKQNFLPEFLNINSYAGRMAYATQHLPKIGVGSGRIVFDIDGEKVLKLAKNQKGVAQNETESGAGYYRDTQHIVTEIFESADNNTWLISEKAKKVNEKRIKELTGIPSLNDLFYFLRNYEEQSKGKREIFPQEPEMEEFFWENEFAQDLSNFLANYAQSAGDMGRPSTYGEVLRDSQPTIVLTDYGINDDVIDTHYNSERKRRYQMYELYNYADGNDDILSDTGDQGDIRRGMWAQMPYSVSDGQGVINEKFINFVSNRSKYPDEPISGLPVLTDKFHECVNNIKEVLSVVENKKQFYGNLLELQNYLIRRGFYDRDPLISEEYVINEEIPAVQPYSLDDRNYGDELANQVAGKLGLTTPRFLGGGANGFAYEINDNLVMKLTSDISEADAASKLMRGQPQYIAKIYNQYKIFDSDKNQTFFAIMQDNIKDKPLDKIRHNIEVINQIEPQGMGYEDIMVTIKRPARFDYNQMVELAKHILTDNPEAGFSQSDRQAAHDFLIGLLNIRKELLDFGIKSTDYITIANLGYKNGVLTFFDVGGYHGVTEPNVPETDVISLPENELIGEEYDRNTADRIANQVAAKLGLNITPISGGTFGFAYDIGNNRVLKITMDNSEAAENLMLIGKPLKYIAQPYNVYEIKPNTDTSIPKTWAIILEKLNTDPNIKRLYQRLDFAFEKILGLNMPDVIEHYLGDWENPKLNKNKIDSYFKKNPQDAEFFGGLLRIAEECKSYGIASMDYLNSSNLGYKPNGALGFFDVGFGDGFLQPQNLEKIEVDEDGSSKFTQSNSINQDDFPVYNNNDTSPSINNNLNANSAMYEDLEYNHVVGDATDDKYEISEKRNKSIGTGSKTVEVKKKCKLGGLGNTSVACNQGDINNLEFGSVNETGEGNVIPYPTSVAINIGSEKTFKFTTEDNDVYEVRFDLVDYIEHYWKLVFGVDDDSRDDNYVEVVNKGRLFKIMATLVKLTGEFINNVKPERLIIEPTNTTEGDNRRYLLYSKFVEKHIPKGYEIEKHQYGIELRRKNNLNESFSFNKEYWGWASPDNRLIQVPKLNHKDFIMRQYKDEEFGWDYDRVFDQALIDGWVRITYEYSSQQFRGDLSINGHTKERVVKIFKTFFYDMVKYGYYTIYLEWENPTKGHLVFNTRDAEGKTKLVNQMNEYYSSLVPDMNENIMSLQDLPFKEEIEKLGGNIYSVGGAVRDEFLGKQSKDLDILISGIPMDELEQLLSKYGGVNNVGKSFGVLKFVPKGSTEEIDVAIPRTDMAGVGGGHKDILTTSNHELPIEKDLERRDFTINAIAKDVNGEIIDPYGGQDDLKNKIIRAVNPEAFSDDPLRMLRAVQFASRFGFEIEPKTMQMIIDSAASIKKIASERILIELDKIVTKGNSLIGVQLLSSTGLFKQIFGNEIKPSQLGRRDFSGVRTMGELLFLMMDGVVQNPAEFYLSRFSTEDAKRDKTYKELQALDLAFNSDLFDQQMIPVKARSIAHNMFKIAPQTLESQIIPEQIENAAQELLQGKYPKTVNELAVNGNDLMQKGLQGKAVGDMQKSMLIQVYADKVRNNKEELLSLLTEKNKEMQEGYPNYNDLRPSTWNINDKQVGIDFFVKEYDKWNNKAGYPAYREASRESVMEFLENNFEDFINDEKLNKELYWALTDRDLLKEEDVKKINYSAVVLDKKSRASLIKVFKPMIPEGWEIIAHHMTIKMGGLENGSKEKQDMENEVEISLKVLDYAIDDKVMAVGVEGYSTTNAKPHITIAVNRAEGGKPFMSNKLNDWRPIDFLLKLTGKVKEE